MSKKLISKILNQVIQPTISARHVVEAIKNSLSTKALSAVKGVKRSYCANILEAELPDDSQLKPETDVDADPTDKQEKDLSPDTVKESKKV